MKRALLIFALAPFVMAQAKPPVLSDAQKAAFWKAQASIVQAEAEVDKTPQGQRLNAARANWATVAKQLEDACGPDFQPQMSKDGDPVCVAKPAAKPDVKTEQKKP